MKIAVLLIIAVVAAANGIILRIDHDPFEGLSSEEESAFWDYSSDKMVTPISAVGEDLKITEADETVKSMTDSHERHVDIPRQLLEDPKQESERMIRALTLEIETAKRETEQKINIITLEAEAAKRETDEKMKNFQKQIEAAKQEAESKANAIAQKRGVQEETLQKFYQQKRPKITMRQSIKKTETELMTEYDSGVVLDKMFNLNSAAKVMPRMFCPPNFIRLEGGCYHFSDHVVLDWNQAQKKCQEIDRRSVLVNIGSSTESKVLKMYLREQNLNLKNWWIGASDRTTEGKWTWVGTNEPLSFFNWCPNEPNGGTKENCLHLAGKPSAGESFCWNDLPCINPGTSYPTNYICEVQPY